jgi:hypothetical protein
MNKRGSYIGGHSVIRDPARSARLARRLRKTKQAEKRRERDRKRLAADMAAYERAQSVLIKGHSGPKIGSLDGEAKLDGSDKHCDETKKPG